MDCFFLGATPDFDCKNPYLPEKSVDKDFYEELLNYTTPWVSGNKGKVEPSKCSYYDRGSYFNETTRGKAVLNNAGVNDTTSDDDRTNLPDADAPEEEVDVVKCTSWTYNQSVFTTTLVTEWDLVCDKSWLRPTIQSTFMLGILTGAVIGGGFADRFGRKMAIMISLVVLFLSGMAAGFSSSLGMFLFFRFLLGAAIQSILQSKFVLVLEITGKKNRDFYGNVCGVGWAVGEVFLAVLAYRIRIWRTLQFVIGAMPAILLIAHWIVPESPRWLLMNGRTKQGIRVLKQIGKANGGRALPDKEDLDSYLSVIRQDVLAKRKKNDGNFFHGLKQFFHRVYLLVKTKNMRRRSLVLFYNAFVVSMSYYGASFSGENINVSLHYFVAFLGCVGILVHPVQWISVIKLGRRVTLCGSMFCSGVLLGAITLVPAEYSWLNLILSISARLTLTMSFYSVFFYSNELVPTHIRNTSLGIASMWARLGSSIAPFMVDLLGAIYYVIPSAIFGVLCLVAGMLGLLLPETSKTSFPESFEEIELLPR